MAKFFVQYSTIHNNENLSTSINICKSQFKISPNASKKVEEFFKKIAEVVQSGHTCVY